MLSKCWASGLQLFIPIPCNWQVSCSPVWAWMADCGHWYICVTICLFFLIRSNIPSGKHTKSYWTWSSRNSWFTPQKWCFPIVFSMFTRGYRWRTQDHHMKKWVCHRLRRLGLTVLGGTGISTSKSRRPRASWTWANWRARRKMSSGTIWRTGELPSGKR